MQDLPDIKRRGLLGRLVATGAAVVAGAATAAPSREERAAYQVDELDRATLAMRQAVNHLDASPKCRIVIVAIGSAVDFLVDGTAAPHGNSYPALVETLQFRGVTFRACNNTLKARGIDAARLLPDVGVVESGIAELVRLQVHESYAYIKV